MALSVATLAGYPEINSTFQVTAGTPTDAATFTFTNGLFTQGGTQYVVGIIDKEGSVPVKVFGSDNGTGGGSTGGTIVLPTLKTIQQLTYVDSLGHTQYGGYIVTLIPAPGTGNSGVTPIKIDVPGYTTASPTVAYPQPGILVPVSKNGLLILASTSTG